MPFTCPICTYPKLSEQPRTEFGGGSYEICPSCGFQFGVDDDDEGYTYETWGKKWLAAGRPWSSKGIPKPKGWPPPLKETPTAPVAPATPAEKKEPKEAAASKTAPAPPKPAPTKTKEPVKKEPAAKSKAPAKAAKSPAKPAGKKPAEKAKPATKSPAKKNKKK